MSTTYTSVEGRRERFPRHASGAMAPEQHPPELTWGYLADSGRVPAIALVAVGRLDENSTVTEALCKDLPSNVVEPHTPPCRGQKILGQRDQPPGQLGQLGRGHQTEPQVATPNRRSPEPSLKPSG